MARQVKKKMCATSSRPPSDVAGSGDGRPLIEDNNKALAPTKEGRRNFLSEVRDVGQSFESKFRHSTRLKAPLHARKPAIGQELHIRRRSLAGMRSGTGH